MTFVVPGRPEAPQLYSVLEVLNILGKHGQMMVRCLPPVPPGTCTSSISISRPQRGSSFEMPCHNVLAISFFSSFYANTSRGTCPGAGLRWLWAFPYLNNSHDLGKWQKLCAHCPCIGGSAVASMCRHSRGWSQALRKGMLYAYISPSLAAVNKISLSHCHPSISRAGCYRICSFLWPFVTERHIRYPK